MRLRKDGSKWKLLVIAFGAGAASLFIMQSAFNAYQSSEQLQIQASMEDYSDTVTDCIESRDKGNFHEIRACAVAQQKFNDIVSLKVKMERQPTSAQQRDILATELAHRRFQAWKLECELGFTFDALHPLECTDEPVLVDLE